MSKHAAETSNLISSTFTAKTASAQVNILLQIATLPDGWRTCHVISTLLLFAVTPANFEKEQQDEEAIRASPIPRCSFDRGLCGHRRQWTQRVGPACGAGSRDDDRRFHLA